MRAPQFPVHLYPHLLDALAEEMLLHDGLRLRRDEMAMLVRNVRPLQLGIFDRGEICRLEFVYAACVHGLLTSVRLRDLDHE